MSESGQGRLTRAPCRCDAVLPGHRGAVWCLAACPGGGGAASGGADKTVRVWEVPRGDGGGARRVAGRVLRGHRGAVVAVAGAGRRLVSASGDGGVRVWAAGSWACLRELAGGGEGRVVRCLAGDGGRVLGGSDDGAVRVWDVETLEEVTAKAEDSDAAAGGVGGGPVLGLAVEAEVLFIAAGRDVLSLRG